MSLSSNYITITEITGVFFRLYINADVASFFAKKINHFIISVVASFPPLFSVVLPIC